MEVASYYKMLYANAVKKAETGALALALSAYVTNSNLAGNVGTTYGFAVSTTGLGTATVNVGINGAAFGINNNTIITITELLRPRSQGTSVGCQRRRHPEHRRNLVAEQSIFSFRHDQ